ncbi:MAG: PorT family protein [Prolixibacteraceae bacterium]|jgi:hypothetical protein|nr:PorT family protein [Prolixibacteraceae bacterium]MBT6767224.1 PorT family protein [Prolixibacteraceae bacterium]MBT6999150.1 PorT family protein [Prolixibacteraceae bacterium]MBT7394374.1 PorT family protein [Prolixibacteraceae bacterium]
MKQILFSAFLILSTVSLFAQPTFDLGLKAGVNKSKVTTSISEFKAEPVVKAHFGVFGRIGWDRIYVQPEAYFSAKGGDLNSGILNTVTAFDFNTIDVPVLLGVKVIKGGMANVRIMGGPVFSVLTSNKIDGNPAYTVQYFKDSYFGFQYGIGADISAFTLDLRMDHGSNDLYAHPNLQSKNRTFMVTVGFKIL